MVGCYYSTYDEDSRYTEDIDYSFKYCKETMEKMKYASLFLKDIIKIL
jgi:hypothetical protein